jgi:hypothetical protein
MDAYIALLHLALVLAHQHSALDLTVDGHPVHTHSVVVTAFQMQVNVSVMSVTC